MDNKVMISEKVQKFSKSLTYTGILLFLLGIIAIAYPSGMGNITAITIGIFMVIGGVFRMIFSVASFSMGSMILRYLFAFLMVIAGIWVISNPEMSLKFLTILMAVYFIVDGATEIAYSSSLLPIGGGIYLLISGIIGIILGVLIFLKWPESSNYALGIFLGIKLIIDGLMLTLTGRTIKKTIQKI